MALQVLPTPVLQARAEALVALVDVRPLLSTARLSAGGALAVARHTCAGTLIECTWVVGRTQGVACVVDPAPALEIFL